MCGIAGVIDPNGSPETRERMAARMGAAMRHRGPDDQGMVTSGPATLAMRRLAIFDPAHGKQPMRTADGRFTLVFNGAIYNFRALRAELGRQGWPFRTRCDSEVLLAAYVHWGERCLARLRGMFAFAVWDQQEQSLFLARDPFGIKPLYYQHTGSRLLFASELNALVGSGGCAADLDPCALHGYLAWLAIPAPRTPYRGVFSLRAGESAVFRRGTFEVRAHWSFPAQKTGRACRSREEFTQELRARLDDGIRAHLAADVPVGAFLSGGLDSAVVAALATQSSGAPLRTFAIAFEESGYNEAPEAEETARHLGTIHRTTLVSGRQVAEEVETLLASLDQPTGDGINLYYASAAARAGGVTVALSGAGADELFGGYPSFRDIPRLARWLPAWRALPEVVRRPALARLDRGDTRQRKLADILRFARDANDVAALHRRVFPEQARLNLLSPDLAASSADPFHPERANLREVLREAGGLETASAWELRTYLADVLLRDSDALSMRHSLEVRVPFVDRPLIEWLWQQPPEYTFVPGPPKSALYAAVRDLLPRSLATRPKRGFTLPFPIWMKRELRPFLEETFSTGSISASGMFAVDAVARQWKGFMAGSDTREWSRIWSLAVLIAFTNRRAAPMTTKVGTGVPILVRTGGAGSPSRPGLQRHAQTISCSNAECQTGSESQPHRSRTLLLAPEIFASEGGIARSLQLYLKALCEIESPERSVRLVALNDRGFDGTDFHRANRGSLAGSVACGRNKARFILAALRLSRDCDAILCGHIAQLPVAWLARRLNPRLRYTLVAHGIEVWRPFRTLERVALRGAARILCVSDFTRRKLLQHCPLSPGRAMVLPNALDPAFPISPGRPLARCAPEILTVSRLSSTDRYKGVASMIEAMPAVRSAIPDATLKIVGRGDDRPRLEALRDQLGLSGSVTFLGYLEDDRLAAELRTCRLFALPSTGEGFGLVYLEAMAHGRPCLGARAGGVPEVIAPKSGVLIDPRHPESVANGAVEALQREWDEAGILDQARAFSYPVFRSRLASALAA